MVCFDGTDTCSRHTEAGGDLPRRPSLRELAPQGAVQIRFSGRPTHLSHDPGRTPAASRKTSRHPADNTGIETQNANSFAKRESRERWKARSSAGVRRRRPRPLPGVSAKQGSGEPAHAGMCPEAQAHGAWRRECRRSDRAAGTAWGESGGADRRCYGHRQPEAGVIKDGRIGRRRGRPPRRAGSGGDDCAHAAIAARSGRCR